VFSPEVRWIGSYLNRLGWFDLLASLFLLQQIEAAPVSPVIGGHALSKE
jgi:hypothetical protein